MIQDILKKLIDEKYSVLVISKGANVPYMRVYRAVREGAKLTDEDQGKIKAFAFVQPAFTRSNANGQ